MAASAQWAHTASLAPLAGVHFEMMTFISMIGPGVCVRARFRRTNILDERYERPTNINIIYYIGKMIKPVQSLPLYHRIFIIDMCCNGLEGP